MNIQNLLVQASEAVRSYQGDLPDIRAKHIQGILANRLSEISKGQITDYDKDTDDEGDIHYVCISDGTRTQLSQVLTIRTTNTGDVIHEVQFTAENQNPALNQDYDQTLDINLVFAPPIFSVHLMSPALHALINDEGNWESCPGYDTDSLPKPLTDDEASQAYRICEALTTMDPTSNNQGC